jgi:hypothetical protein
LFCGGVTFLQGFFAHNACFGVVFLWSRCGDLRG